MRFNLFIPFKPKARWLAKGRLAPRVLDALGPTWRSPLRRLTQLAMLGLFLGLLFYVAYPRGGPPWAGMLDRTHSPDAELFLELDPLAVLSAAIAGRAWIESLAAMAVVLGLCLLVPRMFCGYICPLGTLIDIFDWLIGKRIVWLRRKLGLARPASPRTSPRSSWTASKYFLLALVLVASLMGVMVGGFLAAIPLVTRGLVLGLGPVEQGWLKGWQLVPAIGPETIAAAGLLAAVLLLGIVGPRFWCRYVCPSGAVFSMWSFFRLTERKVTSACNSCGRCAKVCPFDAIKPDFTTRTTDCTLCQTCGGACPAGAIQFAPRWGAIGTKPAVAPEAETVSLSRRGFLVGGLGGIGGGLACGLVIPRTLGAALLAKDGSWAPAFVRPPGSMPERDFLRMCVRCGQCVDICPTNFLQPLGFELGMEGLWTPRGQADWAGCDPTCNLCSQVCPTGAIRKLPLNEKQAARMGQAAVDEAACLPHAGLGKCQLCKDQCDHAGHEAIELRMVRVEVDEQGRIDTESGFLAPVVDADKCVGCGLCQARCNNINVREQGLLGRSAIVVQAGPGKEDRLAEGSYVRLRQAREEQARRRGGRQDPPYQEPAQGQIDNQHGPAPAGGRPGSTPLPTTTSKPAGGDYLPDFL